MRNEKVIFSHMDYVYYILHITYVCTFLYEINLSQYYLLLEPLGTNMLPAQVGVMHKVTLLQSVISQDFLQMSHRIQNIMFRDALQI